MSNIEIDKIINCDFKEIYLRFRIVVRRYVFASELLLRDISLLKKFQVMRYRLANLIDSSIWAQTYVLNSKE